MQRMTHVSITASEKCTLMLDSTQNNDKATGMQNLGQMHRVIVHALRVCWRQLLCKI